MRDLVASALVVSSLAHRERNVTVFYHVLDLASHYSVVNSGLAYSHCLHPYSKFVGVDPLTRQAKQYNPVHHQHRPEDRHVEDLEPAAEEADGDRSSSAVPEFEFRQTPDERPELLICL